MVVVSAKQKQKQQHHQKREEEEEDDEQKPIFLRKGSVVEVSTDEEGFKDAWFVATIIKPPSLPLPPPTAKSPSFRGQQVHVEYKTLFVDDNLSKPLRERLHVRFVRPLPPTTQSIPSFQLHDVVDAFYRDGWWTGVITKVLQGSRFIVTFRNPPDVLEFGLLDLRLHFDWVNGSWVRPQKQEISGLMYSVGKKVEVALEKEGFWFPATIVEDPGNGSFLVEYQTPDGPHLRKVTVDYSHIRPSPPLFKDQAFDVLNKVDAFYDFGWRTGLLTQSLADNRYQVYFRETKEYGEFNHSEIRHQLLWKDGKWFPTSQGVKFPHHENPEGHVHSDPNGTNTDVPNGSSHVSENNTEGKESKEQPAFPSRPREKQDEQFGSGHEELLKVTTSPKKRARYPASDSGKARSQPVEKLSKGVDVAIGSLITSQKKLTASEKQSEGMVSDVNSPPSNSTRANLHKGLRSGDQPSNNPLGMDSVRNLPLYVGESKAKKMMERKRRKIVEEDYHTPSLKKNPGRSANLLSKQRRSSSASKEGSGVKIAAEVVEKECRAKEADLSIILGLECIKTSSSGAGESRKLHVDESLKLKGDQKQQTNDPSVHNKEVRAGESIQKRQRGRPKKVRVGSLTTPVKDKNGNTAKEEVIVKDCINSEVDSVATAAAGIVSLSVEDSAPSEVLITHNGDGEKVIDDQLTQNKESGNTMKLPPAQMALKKNDQGSTKQLERYTSKRTKRRMTSVNQNFLIQDSSDASGGKIPNSTTKEVNKVSQEGLNSMSDDQPLSKWFEEMQSPGTADGATRDVEQSTDLMSKKQKLLAQNSAVNDEGINALSKEVVTQSPAVDKNIVVVSEPEDLPFVKNTTLWATVECMEAFQKMPQKPHFRPLKNCKESSREGLAIASMVTFSSAVEKISKLQFDDPRDKIEDILDSLNDLETHGFDVQILRNRIAELISIQDKRKKLHGEVMEINSQIVTCNLEKAEKDEEIAEINKQIQELQEKIVVAESVKEMKDGEIASLQKKLLDLEESLSSGRTSFEGLAGGVL